VENNTETGIEELLNKKRAKFAIIFILIAVAMELLSVFLGSILDNSIYEQYWIIFTIFLLLTIITYIISVVMFLRWFYRAYSNLHNEFANLKYSKKWAILGWFIPFANLWIPCKIMKELHEKTTKLISTPSIKDKLTSVIVLCWCVIWVISVILNMKIFGYYLKYPYYNSKTMSDMELASEALSIILAILTVTIIYTYSQVKEHLLEENKKDKTPSF
jgi:heme/copper-type cytochrome/quinol oxidase subunit 2